MIKATRSDLLSKIEIDKLDKASITRGILGSSNDFIVNVGDEGAIISYYQNKKLETRLFVNITDPGEKEKILQIFKKDEEANIYLLIDVLEQNYNEQRFPPVNPITLSSLVKNKLRRDFGDDVLKDGYLIEKVTTGKPEWRYIFITCPLISPVNSWIEYLLELPNLFKGIYLLPLEAANIVKKLNKISFATKPKEKSDWQILLLHNKVSGFRQMAYYKDKLIFTRLINDDNEKSPDVIAGTIDQEIHNSIEYLKRLANNFDQEFDIYIICSNEIKESLATINLPGKFNSVLTPFEVSTKLNLSNIVKQEDRYGDALAAGVFVHTSKYKRFDTKDSKIVSIVDFLVRKLPAVAIALFVSIVILAGYRQFSLTDVSGAADQAQRNKDQLEAQLIQIREKDLGKDGDKILEFAKIYKSLVPPEYTLFRTLNEFLPLRQENVNMISFDWVMKEETSSTTPTSQQGMARPQAQGKTQISAKFELEFTSLSPGYRELWDSYNTYIRQINEVFKDYEVTTSQVSDRITFDDRERKIPISLTINGPKAKEAGGVK